MSIRCNQSLRVNAPQHKNRRASGRISSVIYRLALLFTAIPVSMFAVGCGNGSTSFDGGHIPTGNSSVVSISGKSFNAESVTTPVAGATVSITNLSVPSSSVQLAQTGSDGSFVVALPDTLAKSTVQVTVTPPVGSDRQPQRLTIPASAGVPLTVLVSMPQIGFDVSSAVSVTVVSSSLSVHSGDTIAVGAELLNAQGKVLPDAPSMVFSGSNGILQPDGLFTSTSVGTGSVTAYWNNGLSQLQSTASITADTKTTVKPPPPPVGQPGG